MKQLITACIALALLVGPATLAGSFSLTDRAISVTDRAVTRSCKLEPTEAGFKVGAAGEARFTKSSAGESIGVRVEAKVEDRTLMIVSVDLIDGRNVDIGSFYTFMGGGTLEMTHTSKMFPIDDIQGIAVRVSNDVLLEGSCGTSTDK